MRDTSPDMLRWGNLGFGLLERPNVRVLAALSAWLVAGPRVAHAAPTAPEKEDLETDFVVTGEKREDRGPTVESIDAKTVDRFAAHTALEAIDHLPSISAGQNGLGERLFTMRGFDQREVAVFLDGVPLAFPFQGSIDLNKLSAALVSRITLFKGAAAQLYGPGGLGGAVSIAIPDAPSTLSASALTETSPGISAYGNAVAGAGFGPVQGSIAAGYQAERYTPLSGDFHGAVSQAAGDRANSDLLSGSLYTKWSLDLGKRDKIGIAGGAFEGRYGIPPQSRVIDQAYARWADWYARTVSIHHLHHGKDTDTEELIYANFYGSHLDEFTSPTISPRSLFGHSEAYSRDKTFGASARTSSRVDVAEGRPLVVSTLTSYQHQIHTSETELLAPVVPASTNVLSTSGKAELTVVPGSLVASAGAEIEVEIPASWNGESPAPDSGFNPFASLTWTPKDWLSLAASIAARTRFPTLEERFSPSQGELEASPNLTPEHATHFAIDATYKQSRALRFAASFFDSELHDAITVVQTAPGVRQLQNVERARYMGGEGQIKLSPLPWVDAAVGWMVMSAKSGADLAQPVPYRPVEKGFAELTVSPSIFSVTAIFQHTGAQSYEDGGTGRFVDLPSFQTFDARLDLHATRAVRAWVRVSNIFDAAYENQFNDPAAGRQLFFGIASEVGR